MGRPETRGLTQRRRERGEPVGREGLDGPHYFDATATVELSVGDVVSDGEGTAKIVALLDEGDGEGGAPKIEVENSAGIVIFDTRPLNYRAEGPDFPENWVCDELVVEPAS